MKEYIVQAYDKKTIDAFDAQNAPEIVRCKDCRYYHGKNEECGARSFYPPSGDWFCADGERW